MINNNTTFIDELNTVRGFFLLSTGQLKEEEEEEEEIISSSSSYFLELTAQLPVRQSLDYYVGEPPEVTATATTTIEVDFSVDFSVV